VLGWGLSVGLLSYLGMVFFDNYTFSVSGIVIQLFFFGSGGLFMGYQSFHKKDQYYLRLKQSQ